MLMDSVERFFTVVLLVGFGGALLVVMLPVIPFIIGTFVVAGLIGCFFKFLGCLTDLLFGRSRPSAPVTRPPRVSPSHTITTTAWDQLPDH